MDVEHCRQCGYEITDTRFALARSKTGDLVFCGGQCWRDWESDAVNRIERVDADETFVELCSQAIQRQHPNADWLIAHGHVGETGLTNAAIAAAIERLSAWISEHDRALSGTG